MIYRCRCVKPNISEWYEVEANTPEDAANDFMFENYYGIHMKTDRPGELCYYAVIEVENHGEFIARRFRIGIRRRGGVPSPASRRTLDDIAKILDVPKEKLKSPEPWYGEEPYPGESLEDYYHI